MSATLHPPTRTRVGELLDAMAEVRALVVGDLMLDRYLLGDVDRISPEAPVPVLTVEQEWATAGGAANVAANVAAIGAEALVVGITGDDDAAPLLCDALSGYGIRTDGVLPVPGRPTTTKTRIIARGQQVVRLDREVNNPLSGRHRDTLREMALSALADADVLLLEDYDKGVLDSQMIVDLIGAARELDIPVVADPKERHFFDYRGATVFKPNRRELGGAFRVHLSGEDEELRAARERLGVENLLLTLGDEGMALVGPDGLLLRAPSFTREVFDVSGAGDTVAAWVGTALAAGASMSEAVWLANLAAGVEVGKQGTATVSPSELVAAWEQHVGD